MTKSTKDMKIGELLRALDLVNERDIEDTIKMALQVGLPLGRALVLAGLLRDDDLKVVLEIQNWMRTAELPLAVARKAMGLVRSEGLPIREALQRAGWDVTPEASPVTISRLGSLLVESQVINQEQLEEAQSASYETGIPLGRMLSLMGAVPHGLLAKALEIQEMIRDGRMSYARAVQSLNPLHTSKPPLEQNLVHHGMEKPAKKKTMRLGELLMLSGILTESDIMNSLELSFGRQQSFGDILIELGLITKELLDLALELQTSVCDGNLTVRAATDALHYVATTGSTPAVSEEKAAAREVIRIGDLLTMAELVDQTDISEAMELSTRYPSLIGKMLVVAGAIDEAVLLAALRCQFLLRNNLISVDDAVKGLQYAERHQCSLDDALGELGLTVPAPLRRDIAMRGAPAEPQ